MPSLDAIQSVADARKHAQRRLPWMIFDFIDGGAGEERTDRRNQSALEAVELMPRVFRNVEQRRLGVTLLGHDYGLPFGIAPMGMCNLSWPGADAAFAASAIRHNLPHCLSTAASTSLEDAFAHCGERAWFQLYVSDADAAWHLVQRAQDAGYKHLILTVDTPVISRRRRELRRGFKVPFRIGPSQFVDFALHPRWSLSTLWNGPPTFGNNAAPDGKPAFNRAQSRSGVDWRFLDKLRAAWPHLLIVKGVLHPDDARRIAGAGVDAIYVSNHGGRQLDSAPAALSRLRVLRETLGPEYPLIFDSGIRSGEDIVKAYALGADYVMLGRPFLYAVAAAGRPGVAHIVDLLAEEVSTTLAQLGQQSLLDVDGACLASAK
ncbi:MAG: alpha-hydroxy acid oxidase [Pseudomonadota bacterium]